MHIYMYTFMYSILLAFFCRIFPEYRYNKGVVTAVLSTLSIVHIIVTGCVLISYMVINRPQGPGKEINDLLQVFGYVFTGNSGLTIRTAVLVQCALG